MANALARLKALMGEDAFDKAEAEAKAVQESEKATAPGKTDSGQLNRNTKVPTTVIPPASILVPSTHESNQSWKEKRQQTRTLEGNAERERVCSALRRTQRYLGLRPKVESTMCNTDEPVLDYNSPPRHPFDLDAILISIDIEADETNHSNVTEIGISTLDTREIHDLNPGPNGEHWLSKMKSRHIRINEHLHIRNHQFVIGNPDGFNDTFGASEFISLTDAAELLHQSFHPGRNMILIGHGIKNDIRWLKCLGFDILDLPNLIEVLQTEDLQKALKHDSQGGTNLAGLLRECSIQASGLHNAGNDAAYTLQAMIVMVLRSLSITRPILSLEDRIDKAVRKAREQAEAEWEAWRGAEMRIEDGREPVPYRSSVLRG